ncbi:hypothetical protein AN618_11480 [Fervidicola ferrireducens]|uniref:DUF2933 domain-containing protein n=1 Tax=Fervidicola ferrireducens TaxID=520764 RepID=A0A140LA45_9FIRM|nr:DUF2933 domain-containing protein [Fervidicola ferrireducens]KXG77420.1 hypothetical protein AN618_11480 [Fervidicola ferrireducens]
MNKNNRGLLHGFLMALGCVFMIVAVALLARRFGTAGNILSYALVLLCPLMHVFMMLGMHGGHGKHAGHEDERLNRDKVEGLKENA